MVLKCAHCFEVRLGSQIGIFKGRRCFFVLRALFRGDKVLVILRCSFH